MAAKIIGRTTLLASALMLAMGLNAPVSAQSSQDFQMRVEYAVTYTPFEPNGHIDLTPPYTLCGNNQMALRFRYTWRKTFQEYVYTEALSELWPYMYLQGVNPNPLLVPASPAGSPVVKMVDAGLISGQVNTSGLRQVLFRGRTSGFFGNPVIYATTSALIETQIPPPPTGYREIEEATLDMPTLPWFGWAASLSDSYRFDIGACPTQDPNSPSCGQAALPSVAISVACGDAPRCWAGAENEHQLTQALDRDKRYQYRVYGLNQCGLSEQSSELPSFRTAQACFVSGANIPDGGVVNVDAATLGLNPGSLVPNLRVTVHADHADVSDLRISLTKTSPVVAGPLLLMDRPTGTSCIGGTRIQTAFADNGSPLSGGCNALEPAISGRTAPLQALASFAPIQGEGTWRLTIEDTEADGRAGTLREWCLSADVPLTATAMLAPTIFANGFE
ncbi:MAG TPA: hypothetical protein VN259_12910 [Xanthomonadales bacterium]|nr:hypothetical protein [Xanthomonadales bacterium]